MLSWNRLEFRFLYFLVELFNFLCRSLDTLRGVSLLTHNLCVNMHVQRKKSQKASPHSLITWYVQIFFTWRHGGHMGSPKERNGSHFDGTKQPLSNLIPFLCRFYLLLFKINMVAGHVSANHLLETQFVRTYKRATSLPGLFSAGERVSPRWAHPLLGGEKPWQRGWLKRPQ